MEMNEKKVITVLFTRYYSSVSNFIYLISGKGYTHVSLAFDEQNEYYYSFNVRGFRKEYPQKHKWRSGKSMGIKLEVPQEDFDKMERKIGEMERERDKFHYSRLGVLFCLLHIPCKLQNRYFCSQFVAETDRKSVV